jgi:hypothetical protein
MHEQDTLLAQAASLTLLCKYPWARLVHPIAMVQRENRGARVRYLAVGILNLLDFVQKRILRRPVDKHASVGCYSESWNLFEDACK